MKHVLTLAALMSLAACGGGGGGGGGTIPGGGGGPPTPTPPPPVLTDDWTTFAHDHGRTGFESTSTITPSNVAQLGLAWRQAGATLDPACVPAAQATGNFVDEASPIVAGGLVYVADECGMVTALRRATGDIAWQRQLPLTTDYGSQTTTNAAVSGVYGTPELDLANNTLIVPMEGIYTGCSSSSAQTCIDYAHGGYLAALNASTGAVEWEAPKQINSGATPGLASGNMRGEPIIINGTVIEGIAGGDGDAGQRQGGLIALSESTGATLAIYTLAPPLSPSAPYDGGSSWSPISFDGTYIYAGTGNTTNSDGDFDGVVQFNPSSLAPSASYIPTVVVDNDEDIGGGVLLWGGNMYFAGKDGYFYEFPVYQPSMQLIKVLINKNSSPSGNGSIGTPTTDGTVVAISTGYNLSGYQSDLDVFPLNSGTESSSCQTHQLRATNSTLPSYAAWVPGIGFTPLDNGVASGSNNAAPAFEAFDDQCNVLWRANPGDIVEFFYAGAAVVASGVYAVDVAGNVYSWKLPTMVGIAARSRHDLMRPAQRIHFIYKHRLPKSVGHVY
jgi:outer membrane protein assembly factor BamB